MESQAINLSPQEMALIQEMLSQQNSLPQIDPKIFSFLIIGAIIVTIWSLVWKGFALWRSARNRHKGWFIFMLILNTAGILEIVYLIIYRKRKVKEIPSVAESQNQTRQEI